MIRAQSCDFYDSYIGYYFERDRGYANLSYFYGGRFLLVVDAGAGPLVYPQMTLLGVTSPFSTVRVDASLFGEYRFKDSFGINATVRREITADLDKTRAAPLASLAAREDGPFWYRGVNQMEEPDVDALLAAQHATGMVIGHTISSTSRVAFRFGGKVIAIDTGMQPAYAQGGRASALEIRHDTITAIYSDRRDVLKSGT
jgi:hypothetical protein